MLNGSGDVEIITTAGTVTFGAAGSTGTGSQTMGPKHKLAHSSRASGDQTPETPAEMAERVHQVIAAIAEGVLKLAYERFGPNLEKLEEEKRKSKDQPIDTGHRQQ